MELKEYYKIFRENVSTVVYTVIIAVVIAYAWSMKISETYSTSLLINLSRAETQPTTDYKYDQFYRLEADEKFAETIVEWLKTPGVAKNIYEKAGIGSDQKTMRQLEKSFRAEKSSSNLVRIAYSTPNSEEAEKIASAIEFVISEKTKRLNSAAKETNWFEVNMSDLVTLKNSQDLRINLTVAAIVGIFLGTLIAFGKHYTSE